MQTSVAFASSNQSISRAESNELIPEQGVLLLPQRTPLLPACGRPSAVHFYFRSRLLELAGRVEQLTYCLARIRAWTRASWLWPSPDRSKVVLTCWGREGAVRTTVLHKESLLFIQICRPRDISELASAPLIVRRSKNGLLFLFCFGFLFGIRRWSLFFWTLFLLIQSHFELTSSVKATLITMSAPRPTQASFEQTEAAVSVLSFPSTRRLQNWKSAEEINKKRQIHLHSGCWKLGYPQDRLFLKMTVRTVIWQGSSVNLGRIIFLFG